MYFTGQTRQSWYTQGRTTQECEFQEVGIDGEHFGANYHNSMKPETVLGFGVRPKAFFLAGAQVMLTPFSQDLCSERLWFVPYSLSFFFFFVLHEFRSHKHGKNEEQEKMYTRNMYRVSSMC